MTDRTPTEERQIQFELNCRFNRRISMSESNIRDEMRQMIMEESISKSALLRKFKSREWPGYKSSSFVDWSMKIDRIFNDLYREGHIIYEPRKPLKWRD